MGGCKNKRLGRCHAKTVEGKRCGNCTKNKFCHVHKASRSPVKKRSPSNSDYIELKSSSPHYLSLAGSNSGYLEISPRKRSSPKRRSPPSIHRIVPLSYHSHSSSGGFYPTKEEVEYVKLTGKLPPRAQRVIF